MGWSWSPRHCCLCGARGRAAPRSAPLTARLTPPFHDEERLCPPGNSKITWQTLFQRAVPALIERGAVRRHHAQQPYDELFDRRGQARGRLHHRESRSKNGLAIRLPRREVDARLLQEIQDFMECVSIGRQPRADSAWPTKPPSSTMPPIGRPRRDGGSRSRFQVGAIARARGRPAASTQPRIPRGMKMTKRMRRMP
jgi:hypothetical protein